MVAYVREMIVKKSCKYAKYGSFEHLLFLFWLLFDQRQLLKGKNHHNIHSADFALDREKIVCWIISGKSKTNYKGTEGKLKICIDSFFCESEGNFLYVYCLDKVILALKMMVLRGWLSGEELCQSPQRPGTWQGGGASQCTQVTKYHWFFFFFFPPVPQLYLWGSPLLGEIFAYVTFFFFNPTIKVVTFRLRGWCVLGVFLLPAFTRLGHERQDLLSPCDEMHVCTD